MSKRIVIHNYLARAEDEEFKVALKKGPQGNQAFKTITVQADNRAEAEKKAKAQAGEGWRTDPKNYPRIMYDAAGAADAGFLGGQRGPNLGSGSKGKFKKGQIVGIKNGTEMQAKILEVIDQGYGPPQYKVKTSGGYEDPDGPGETMTVLESDLW